MRPEGGGTLGPITIALLALVWVAVLLPSALRSRAQTSPIDGVRRFEQTMGVLDNTRRARPAASGRWIMVPRGMPAAERRRRRMIRRRRQWFVRLLGAAAVTLALGAFPAVRWLWFVHVGVDAAVGLYVWRLLVWKHLESQRAEVVRPIAAADDELAEPDAGTMAQSG